MQDKKPTEDEMVKFLGRQAGNMWKQISAYMSTNYEFEPVREDESLDATIRYRRSGKTILTFYPKKDELTVLVILGKKETEKFESSKDEFSPEIVELFSNTRQYHDGRWLHIKVPPFEGVEDIKKLLGIKKEPKNMGAEN
ncbi:MAG: hypothetical protein C4K48_07655 [Candidatus Thorarchaeota archaeon]|nr:MAG: hypothetical protein C4K48_07655 [Candidatus Thorarchaeota archaeon]